MKQPCAPTAWRGGPVLGQVNREGYRWLHLPAEWSPGQIERAPAQFLRALLGEAAVERFDFTDVAPTPGGTTIVSSNIFGDFHTDGDSWLPAHLQILICERAAKRGGETMLLDGWRLLRRIKSADPRRYQALLGQVRAIRYAEHLWLGPTVALRHQNLFINHSPMIADELGQFISSELGLEEYATFRMGPGDFYVSNNHRMLHGRGAFSGQRRLLRFMVWLRKPLPAPARLINAAAQVSAGIERVLQDKPKFVQARFGLGAPPTQWISELSPRRLGALQDAFNELSAGRSHG